MSFYDYQPAGPVIARFWESYAKVRLLDGPMGSGKTSGGLTDQLIKACNNPPIDGKRVFELLVGAPNFRKLYDTAVKTWDRYVVPCGWTDAKNKFGEFSGSVDRPAVHKFEMPMPDGIPLQMTATFNSFGSTPESVRAFFGSLEPTGIYLAEVSEAHEDVMAFAPARTGRTPAGIGRLIDDKVPGVYSGLSADFNKTDVRHWVYRLVRDIRIGKRPGWEHFEQPPSAIRVLGEDGKTIGYRINPAAENVWRVGKSYFEGLLSNEEWFIIQMCLSEWGPRRDQTAIYAGDWKPQIHQAKETLKPTGEISLAFDAGLKPAVVIGDMTAKGQLRGLAEAFGGHGCGARRFCRDFVKPLLKERFEGQRIRTAVVDPTAFDGVDKQAGELSWVQIVEEELEISIMPAVSNEPELRWEAVRWALNNTLEEGEPGFQLDPSCELLDRGFSSEYAFQRSRITGVLGDRPIKNDPSHPHDCLQYLALELIGEETIVAGMKRKKSGQDRAAMMARLNIAAPEAQQRSYDADFDPRSYGS